MLRTQRQKCGDFVCWAVDLCDCDVTCMTIANRADSAQMLCANADCWVCLKPKTKLRCCIESAELGAHAGKLGMPHAISKDKSLCADSAVLLCNMPSRYVVTSATNPQATNKVERLH